jgi:hypothetical protein
MFYDHHGFFVDRLVEARHDWPVIGCGVAHHHGLGRDPAGGVDVIESREPVRPRGRRVCRVDEQACDLQVASVWHRLKPAALNPVIHDSRSGPLP